MFDRKMIIISLGGGIYFISTSLYLEILISQNETSSHEDFILARFDLRKFNPFLKHFINVNCVNPLSTK